MFRADYIMRMIHQLAEAIARIAGLNRRGDHAKALAAAEQTCGELLDVPRALVDSLDTPTLAGMLRDPAKLRLAAQLFYEEGRALVGTGDPVHAEVRYRRALELLLEATARDPSDEHAELMLELVRGAARHARSALSQLTG